MTTAQAYLTEQRKHLGFHGGPPNGNHTPFGAFTGFQNQAWCGSFQEYCAAQVGLALPGGKTGMVSTHIGYALYHQLGRISMTPAVGAHAFYDWSGRRSPGGVDHIECVESVIDSQHYIAIGGNVNSSVLRVRRTVSPFVVGFGMPVYSGAPAPGHPKPPVAHPVPVGAPSVSLGRVILAAKRDPGASQGHQTAPADVRLVEHALNAEGLLPAQYSGDGSYGTTTISAYAGWQRRLGYSGSSADGIPGTASLTKLGVKHGFRVTA